MRRKFYTYNGGSYIYAFDIYGLDDYERFERLKLLFSAIEVPHTCAMRLCGQLPAHNNERFIPRRYRR